MSALGEASERALSGGPQRHREKASEQGKLGVRERIALLVDERSFAEEALLANWQEDGLGADGVVTGVGTVDGRPVALMANDPTVKAGSWGPKTVEKILRIQERAMSLSVPMVYLVDSAGARITEQVQMFPGRRGAGRIFHNQVKLSGVVPQVCVLFGPSAAGGAYIPAFCDVVIMREGNASMYLGSPRMAEMVIGEKVSLEEMGGARMHTGVSGCGHQLVKSDEEGIATARRYLSYLPGNWEQPPPAVTPVPARELPDGQAIADLIPADENKPFDIKTLIAALVDDGSLLEIQPRWAKELVVGFARLDGRSIGIVANQPKHKGGVLFGDSADKAARFICDVQRVQRAAAVPRGRPRLHDRHAGRARRHHPSRREDDQRGQRGDRAEDLGGRAQGLRRRPLCDGRPGVRAGLLPGAAERVDRRDGPAGGDQRRLLQPAAGDRRRARARAAHRGAARGVRARTSTSCTWPQSSWSTRWSSPRCCATELIRRFAHAARPSERDLARQAQRRHAGLSGRSPGAPRRRALSIDCRPMDAAELAFAGIARQAQLIAAGEVSSRELVELYLERIERAATPRLNAFRVVFAERALLEADQARRAGARARGERATAAGRADRGQGRHRRRGRGDGLRHERPRRARRARTPRSCAGCARRAR